MIEYVRGAGFSSPRHTWEYQSTRVFDGMEGEQVRGAIVWRRKWRWCP